MGRRTGRKGRAEWAGEDCSRQLQHPWPGVTSTGRWPLGAQGGTTKGSLPGRADGQEEETEMDLRPPCVRKGTNPTSLGGRERRKAGCQLGALTLRSSASSHSGASSRCPSSRLYAKSRCRRFFSCSRPGAEARREEGHVLQGEAGCWGSVEQKDEPGHPYPQAHIRLWMHTGPRDPGHPESHTAPTPLHVCPALPHSPAPHLPPHAPHSPCRLRSSLPRSIRVPRATPEGPTLGTKRRWL